jgi:hypothetical protein
MSAENQAGQPMKEVNDPTREDMAGWADWAAFLRRHGIERAAAWVLDAAGPLTLLGAQAIYLGGPLLRPAFSNQQIGRLAALLEDQQEVKKFTAFLIQEPPE